MKRLMVMTGRAGKALLEINGDRSGAAVKYGGPGELWLFDGEGNSLQGRKASLHTGGGNSGKKRDGTAYGRLCRPERADGAGKGGDNAAISGTGEAPMRQGAAGGETLRP